MECLKIVFILDPFGFLFQIELSWIFLTFLWGSFSRNYSWCSRQEGLWNRARQGQHYHFSKLFIH